MGERFFQRSRGKQLIQHIADSSGIFKSGRLEFEKITLEYDPKVRQLLAETKRYIEKHNFKLPQDEEKICQFIVSSIHSDKYYGYYDKTISDLAYKRDFIEKFRISSLSGDPNITVEDYEKAENFEKSLKENSNYYNERSLADENGWVHTEKFPKNTLVCREQAFITSYVMHGVGIENTFICGPNVGTSNHAFVQSKLTGAIIETTSASESYAVPLNKKHNLAKGHYAFVYNDDTGEFSRYGAGHIKSYKPVSSAGENYAKKEQVLNANTEAATYEFARESSKKHDQVTMSLKEGKARGSLKLSDLEQEVIYFFMKKDIGAEPKRLFGKREGAGDFKVSGEELNMPEISLSPELNKVAITISGRFREADKNNDGYITPAELPKLFENRVETAK